jgi:putative tricarboxylic transport membrane protein
MERSQSADDSTQSAVNLAERILSIGIVLFGAFVLYNALELDDAGAGYAGIGARAFPVAISVFLMLGGAGLVWQAFTGGFRNVEDETQGEPFAGAAFGWVLAGLAAQMALIETAGFCIASALLFWCSARGFGSRQPLRDAIYAIAIVLAVYIAFTQGLSVNLTRGWMPF